MDRGTISQEASISRPLLQTGLDGFRLRFWMFKYLKSNWLSECSPLRASRSVTVFLDQLLNSATLQGFKDAQREDSVLINYELFILITSSLPSQRSECWIFPLRPSFSLHILFSFPFVLHDLKFLCLSVEKTTRSECGLLISTITSSLEYKFTDSKDSAMKTSTSNWMESFEYHNNNYYDFTKNTRVKSEWSVAIQTTKMKRFD